MVISITGASGFIGRRLVLACLSSGYEVRILSRKISFDIPGVTLFNADLLDEKVEFNHFVKGADIVINCAGDNTNTSIMFDLHVKATKKLLDESILQGVPRWIQLSSVGAYGIHRVGEIDENSKEAPISVYEKTKTEIDQIIKESGIPYTIVRPSIVFGNNMNNNSIFDLVNILEKRFFFYIGRKAIVNYVHVDDVVNSLMQCVSNKLSIGKVFIVSQSIIVEKMIESLLIGLNIKRSIIHIPEWFVRLLFKGFIQHFSASLTESRIDALTGKSIYSSRKIEKVINFQFETSLEERFKSFSKKR